MSNLLEPVFFSRIRPMSRYYSPTYFVETGCGPPPCTALSLAFALEMQGFSCDIDPVYVEKARARFGGNAEIHLCESLAFLQEVLPKIGDAKTFFFLDAHFPHYPDYITGAQKIDAPEWPLLDEMKLIKELKKGIENDVILIDDINQIADPMNPMYTATYGNAPQERPKGAWRDYVSVFADTHDWYVWRQFEGVLVLQPKSPAHPPW